MKIAASAIRPNTLIAYQGKLWRVYKVEHVKPGKGGAFAQVEMKDIEIGTKLNERFRAEDKVDEIGLESRKMQYLYDEGSSVVFMDNDNYEQLSVDRDFLEDKIGYLLPNTEVQAKLYNDKLLAIELPSYVVLEVVAMSARRLRRPSNPVPGSLVLPRRVDRLPPLGDVGDRRP